MISILLSVIVLGWVAATIIGSQAYSSGEQTKLVQEPVYSQAVERAPKVATRNEPGFTNRIPGWQA